MGIFPLAAAAFAFSVGLPAAPSDEDFSLTIPDVRAEPGAAVVIDVLGNSPVPYQGFSLTVAYPSSELEVSRVGIEGTIIEAIRSEFVHAEVYPDLGIFVVAVLVDLFSPDEAILAPAVGFPLALCRASARILLTGPGEIPLEFVSERDRPYAPNLFVVDNQSVAATVTGGRVIAEFKPPIPAFIRGDANIDGEIDISDFIFLLWWSVLDGRPPQCEAAADANSDQGVDLSDAVFIVNFVFLHGPRPFPPQGRPGPDPTKDPLLGCDQPLVWLPGR